MKVVAFSDIHGNLNIDVPQCDVVCICGDILPLNIQNNLIKSISWLLLDFEPWTRTLPCRKVIFISGNHDKIFETLGMDKNYDACEITDLLWGKHKRDSKLVYLCNSFYEFEGKRFYGTPWCPQLKNWSFYADHDTMVKEFNKIPQDLDVLITHCPPKIGEVGCVRQLCWNHGKNFGCQELADAIKCRNIKWCVCGHVHSGDHNITDYVGTKYVNVSVVDEDYELIYKPFEFDI